MSTALPSVRPIDPDKLNKLLHQAVVDMGAAMQSTLIIIGDRLGLYKAMGGGWSVSEYRPAELSLNSGATHE